MKHFGVGTNKFRYAFQHLKTKKGCSLFPGRGDSANKFSCLVKHFNELLKQLTQIVYSFCWINNLNRHANISFFQVSKNTDLWKKNFELEIWRILTTYKTAHFGKKKKKKKKNVALVTNRFLNWPFNFENTHNPMIAFASHTTSDSGQSVATTDILNFLANG